jgi:NADH-quinone oxidoreductase subunit J
MQYLFFLLAAISVITALVVVAAKSPINSVIALVLCFLSIAGHYILLNAQFLAMVHVIVYTGAILVLMLFVIMLLNMNTIVEVRKPVITRILAVVTGGLLFLVLLAATKQGLNVDVPTGFDPGVGLVKRIGMSLFQDFLLPFEVSSVLFLSAMVGAMMLAKKDGTENVNLPPSSEPDLRQAGPNDSAA